MKTKYFMAFAATALVLAGCSREDLVSLTDSDNQVKIEVTGLQLTKGTLYNSQSEMIDGEITTLNVQAWNNAGFTEFVTSQTATYDESSSKWELANYTKWTGTDEKTFFAYTNLPETGATVVNTCTSLANQKQTLTYDLPLDARLQNDLMLGWYKGKGNGSHTASITLVHPLSSIVLKKGSMSVNAIKSVSISGLYASGTVNVTYALDEDNKVIPTYDWGSSRTGKAVATLEPVTGNELEVAADGTIGVPFVVIPQTVIDAQVKIKAVVTISGEDKTLVIKVPAGEFVAGQTHVFSLGYSEYVFESEGKTEVVQSFGNTQSDATVTIPLTSQRRTGTAGDEISWKIKSVQVGDAAEQTVDDTHFENIGDLSAQKVEGGLKLTAAARTPITKPGSQNYWTDKEREQLADWSPEDWSSTKATAAEPLDLSKFDFQTETTDNPMTTANCYIIRHAGTYKLPLVYGNGVVGGSINKQSYAPVIASGGTNGLTPFQNHLGKGIISPFIEFNTNDGKEKSGSNTYLAPKTDANGYKIVWQDNADIITITGLEKETVTVKDENGVNKEFEISYLVFNIPYDKICQNNAILAVVDGTGIMWSWHIWTTNNPAVLQAPIAVTNSSNMVYKFLPLNCLGWIDNDTYPGREKVKITLAQEGTGNEITIMVNQNTVLGEFSDAPYYQFGRKDPILYKASATTGSNFGTIASGTLANSIKNPDKFMRGTNWCSTTYFNLWTGIKSTAGTLDQDDEMIKTIYDPSPAGYKVPAPKAFTGFSLVSTDGTPFADAKGYYFKTSQTSADYIYFPVGGCRNADDGVRYFETTLGGYWSAVPSSANRGNNFYFGDAYVISLDNSNAAGGYILRPVRE